MVHGIPWNEENTDASQYHVQHQHQQGPNPGAIIGGIVALIGIPVISIVAVPAILGAVGFTAGGIAAGSAAAGIQAGIGNVAAGSAFAVLQSAATGGAGLAVVNGVVGGTAAVAAGAAIVPGMVAAGQNEGDEKKDE